MNTKDRLTMMLLGPKNAAHAKEEKAERKRGVVSTPREEALEDPKGRPIRIQPSPLRNGK